MHPLDRWLQERKDANHLLWLTDARVYIRDSNLVRRVMHAHLLSLGYERGRGGVYIRHNPGSRHRCVVRGGWIYRAVSNDASSWRRLSCRRVAAVVHRVLRDAKSRMQLPPPRKQAGWFVAGSGSRVHLFERGRLRPVCGGGSMKRTTLGQRRKPRSLEARCLRCTARVRSRS